MFPLLRRIICTSILLFLILNCRVEFMMSCTYPYLITSSSWHYSMYSIPSEMQLSLSLDSFLICASDTSFSMSEVVCLCSRAFITSWALVLVRLLFWQYWFVLWCFHVFPVLSLLTAQKLERFLFCVRRTGGQEFPAKWWRVSSALLD